jgi:lipopolysaccharide export system permease protein
MKKITQRYLAYKFLTPFVASLIFFSLFLLVFQLFRLLPVAIKGDMSFLEVLIVMGNIMLSYLPGALPLAGLFSAIYALGSVSDSSEFVVMRSFGMSIRSLIFPFVLIGLSLGFVIYFLNSNVIPTANGLYLNTLGKLKTRGMSIKITPKVFYTEIPGVFIFADEVSEKGDKLKNVFIQSNLNNKESVIYAKEGVLLKKDFGKNRLPGIRLYLLNGNLFNQNKEGDVIERINFEHYNFPVLKGGGLPAQIAKYQMMSNSLLKENYDNLTKKIETLMKVKSLTNYQKKLLKIHKREKRKTILELSNRVLSALQVVLFILIGFCIGINNSRKVARKSALIGISFMLGYYILFFTGVSFFNKGQVGLMVVLLAPLLFSLGIFTKMYRKLQWI